VRDKCQEDFLFLWILLGLTGAGGLAFTVQSCMAKKKEDLVAPPQLETAATQAASSPPSCACVSRVAGYFSSPFAVGLRTVCIFWSLGVLDVTTDVNFNLSMLQYLMVDLKPDNATCATVNNVYNPLLWLYTDFENTTFQNFSEAYTIYNYADNVYGFQPDRVCVSDLITRNSISFSDGRYLLQQPIEAFQRLCTSRAGCVYDDSGSENYTNSDTDDLGVQYYTNYKGACISDAGNTPWPIFTRYVLACVGLVLLKEFVKLIILFWMLFKADGPAYFFPCVRTSPLFWVMFFRPKLFREIVMHKFSPSDGLSQFVYEGCVENIPQIFCGLYYALNVTGIGLSATQLGSIYLSCMKLLHLLLSSASALMYPPAVHAEDLEVILQLEPLPTTQKPRHDDSKHRASAVDMLPPGTTISLVDQL